MNGYYEIRYRKFFASHVVTRDTEAEMNAFIDEMIEDGATHFKIEWIPATV